MTIPNGPSCGFFVPDLRRRTTVLSKVRTPSSFSVATRRQPFSGDEIGWAHLAGRDFGPDDVPSWLEKESVFSAYKKVMFSKNLTFKENVYFNLHVFKWYNNQS